MVKREVIISDQIHARLQKISELLDIEFDDILHLSLVDGGYYRYWINIEKFIDDTPELIDRINSKDNIYEIKQELQQQFHSRAKLIEDIDSLEQNFKKKFKHFSSDIEQHRAFLDFIDMLQTDTIIKVEERQKVESQDIVV